MFPHLVNIDSPSITTVVLLLEIHPVSRPPHRTHFDLLDLSAAKCDFTNTDKQPEYRHTPSVSTST